MGNVNPIRKYFYFDARKELGPNMCKWTFFKGPNAEIIKYNFSNL